MAASTCSGSSVPQVPFTGQPSVAPAPLRVPSAPVETFGGGAASRPVDLSGLGRVTQDIYLNEKHKADEALVTSAGADVSAAEVDMLHNPDTGALNQHGDKAFQLPETVAQSWQKRMGEISSRLTNDDQRAAFQRIAASSWSTVNAQVQQHVANERQAFTQNANAAYIANEGAAAVAAALTNPARIDTAVANQTAKIKDIARTNGWSEDQTQQHIAETVSKTRFDALTRMVDNHQDLTASAYLAKYRDQFTADDLTRAEKLTDAGSIEGSSQRQADSITGTATTFGEAMDQVRQIQDPRVRDRASILVRQFYNDKLADDRIQREQAFNRTTAYVEAGNDPLKAPLTDRQLLTPEQNEALTHRYEQMKHPVVQTNTALYTHLINLSGLNEGTRKAFMGLNLADPKYSSQLSDSDYRHIVNLQGDMLRSQTNADIREEKKGAAGFKETPIQKKEEGEIVRAADQRRKAIAGRAGLPPEVSKYLPPVPKITVAPWMVQHAQQDPDYARYLQSHGIMIPPVAPPQQPPPKVPGAPLTGNIDLRKQP